MARPTEYTPETIDRVKEYLDSCEDEEVQQLTGLSAKGTELYKNKLNVNIPTIEGLAVFLDINKTTVYEWESRYPEFSNVIGILRSIQAERLVNKGLSGDYNPTIAKVLLTKHGYAERTELTGKDGDKLEMGVVILPAKEQQGQAE